MNLVNKCFKIIEEDEELLDQFPEFKHGTEFKVISTDTANGKPDGIIAVQIKGGDYIHVNSRDSWFWCFYCQDTLYQIEEIEELSSDQYKIPDTAHLFKGRDIASQLFKVAGAENCDSEEHDLMQAAGEYIRQLEAQLKFSDKEF